MSTTQPYRRPNYADYDGIKHARVTRKMTQARLPATTRVIMAEVFRDIPVGTWGRVPHRTLARRLDFSESTVSRGMDLLVELGFVDRRPRADGPGYEICPLPPPEMRPKLQRPPAAAKSPAGTPQGASFYPVTVDHDESIPAEAVGTPKNETQHPVTMDDRTFYSHTCSSSMHGARAPYTEPDNPPQPSEPPAPPQGNDLPPVPPDALAGYFLSYQWRQLCKAAPARYGVSDLAADVLKLKTRPDLKWPWKVLVAALERGEPIYTQAEIDARDAELRALASAAPPNDPRPRRRNDRRFSAEIKPENYRNIPGWIVGDGPDESEESLLDQADAARAAPFELLDEPEPPDDAPPDQPEPPQPPPVAFPPAAPPLAALLAAAVALLADAPPDATELDIMRRRLSEISDPARAAQTIRRRRENAARPKRRAPRGGT